MRIDFTLYQKKIASRLANFPVVWQNSKENYNYWLKIAWKKLEGLSVLILVYALTSRHPGTSHIWGATDIPMGDPIHSLVKNSKQQ